MAIADTNMPAAVGNAACDAVLEFRHHDGANQLGDLSPIPTPYADYTVYKAMNPPSAVPVDPKTIVDPSRWQPLQFRDATHALVTQGFLGAQWGNVVPFALSSGDEYRDAIGEHGPAQYGSPEYFDEVEKLIRMSASSTDKQKMIAEYWKDGPNSETPPGHWCLFAQFVSNRDHHNLNEDIKMFFVLTNAEFDASIRPASAIPYIFRGQQIRSWGGLAKKP